MTLTELIDKLESMLQENPGLKDATVEVEYQGSNGCDTCGYGSETTTDVEESKIYDLDTRVIISVI